MQLYGHVRWHGENGILIAMSIIDDTFKKLDEERAALDTAAPVHNPVGPTSDLGYVAGSRKRSPVLFVMLAVIFVGAGVLVYVLLPEAKSPPAPARSLTEAPLAADVPAPPPAAEVAATAPVPATPPVARITAPTFIPQPVVVVAEHAGDAQVPSGAEETEPQGVIPPPSWYEEGWNAARTGNWPKALSAWEEGVRGLPGDRLVITGNSYAALNDFSAVLKQYVKSFPSIGIRQRYYNGQTVYRLLVFPYGGGTRQVLPRVQSMFAHAGLVDASYMQARMSTDYGVAPVSGKAAQAVVEAKPRAVKIDAAPVTKPGKAAAAKAVVDKPLLVKASRMPAANMDAGASGAAARTASDNTRTWESRALEIRSQLKAEAYTDVAKNALQLTRDFPDRWESWFWLGTAQLAQGQLDEADAALERASKLNPKVSQVWVQRAVVAQERGDHAAAVRLLIEARNLSPRSPQIYLNLGYSYDALGSTAEAEKNYQNFLALTDGDAAYLLQRNLVIERLERKK